MIEANNGVAREKRIIYVGGYGRSGSTLLSLLLGQNPNVFSGGELSALRRASRDRIPCGCGKPLDECPIWAKPLVACGRRWLGFRYICEYLDEAAPGTYLLDASKTAYRAMLKPWAYKLLGRQVFFIHLIRDPVGVVKSVEKGTNRQIEQGKGESRRFLRTRAMAGWLTANLAARLFGLVFPSAYIRVSFEELASRPSAALNRLESFLGLEYEPVISSVERREVLSAGHEIAGNRMLRQGPVVVGEPLMAKSGKPEWWFRYIRSVGRAVGYQAARS